MTKVNWLLECDVFDEGNPEKMAEIATSKGMEVKHVGYIPFDGGVRDGQHVHGYDKLSEIYPADACVVAYGSINLVRRLVKEAPWTPTAWMDLDALSCKSYYAHWGHFCLQRDYVMLPWAELLRLKDRLYSSLQEDGCVFVRPNDNTKVFTGKVVHRDEFSKWYDQEEYCYSPSPDSLAVVSRPQKLDAEWRVVVCDRKVVTASLYKRNGRTSRFEEMEAGAPPEVLELADVMARQPWQPQKAYVLDVCLAGGDFKVLEIGDVNAAGLYKCDLEKVVDALSGLALREWEEING